MKAPFDVSRETVIGTDRIFGRGRLWNGPSSRRSRGRVHSRHHFVSSAPRRAASIVKRIIDRRRECRTVELGPSGLEGMQLLDTSRCAAVSTQRMSPGLSDSRRCPTAMSADAELQLLGPLRIFVLSTGVEAVVRPELQ